MTYDRRSEQKRNFSRSPVGVHAHISENSEAESVQGDVLDLSMNGVLVQCATDLPQDSCCHVMLDLEGVAKVEISGIIARKTEQNIAISFSEISGESFEHLHRLVLYNSPDPEQMLEESKHHSGIKAV